MGRKTQFEKLKIAMKGITITHKDSVSYIGKNEEGKKVYITPFRRWRNNTQLFTIQIMHCLDRIHTEYFEFPLNQQKEVEEYLEEQYTKGRFQKT